MIGFLIVLGSVLYDFGMEKELSFILRVSVFRNLGFLLFGLWRVRIFIRSLRRCSKRSSISMCFVVLEYFRMKLLGIFFILGYLNLV